MLLAVTHVLILHGNKAAIDANWRPGLVLYSILRTVLVSVEEFYYIFLTAYK